MIITLLLVVATGTLLLGYEHRANAGRYLLVDSDLAPLLVPLRRLALASGIVALALIGLTHRRWWPAAVGSVALPLRGCLHAVLVAFTAATLSRALGGAEWSSLPVRSVFFSTLLLALSGWVAALALAPERLFRNPRGLARFADVACVQLVLLLLLTEGALGLYARLRPSPILWDEDSISQYVASRRLEPGARVHGFPANSGGFLDAEFPQPSAGDLTVALISDSFGIGTVSPPYGFPAVAERRLAKELAAPGRRVAVNNFSVTGIGMSGYAWLLEHEVLPTEPSLVVLTVFVGNDISGFQQHRSRFYCFQYLRLYKTIRRLWAVQREVVSGGGVLDVGFPGGDRPVPPPAPDAERPTFTREAFLSLERERLERCEPAHPKTVRHFRGFFEALDFFHRRLGERLLLVVIPDEFQVNDDLYAALMDRVPDRSAFDRDSPQRRIAEFCRARGIALLDLLPELRRAQKDGRTYHLRDTHWNARGNQVGGDALAEAILARLADGVASGGNAPGGAGPRFRPE